MRGCTNDNNMPRVLEIGLIMELIFRFHYRFPPHSYKLIWKYSDLIVFLLIPGAV